MKDFRFEPDAGLIAFEDRFGKCWNLTWVGALCDECVQDISGNFFFFKRYVGFPFLEQVSEKVEKIFANSKSNTAMLKQYLVSVLIVCVINFRNFSWAIPTFTSAKIVSHSEGHKCNECEDFVLCATCYSEYPHPHLMTFKRFSRGSAPITFQPAGSKEPPAYVEPEGCDGLKTFLGN